MLDTPYDGGSADDEWMRRALSEAARGQGLVEPNPMVGAVMVRDHRLVGIGHHARFGGPHAEVVALSQAGEGARGATLHVTLEPCCHWGKTPPCTEAIIKAGVARVVVAMVDPFAKVSGGGVAQLRAAGIVAEVGRFEEAARELNAPYLKRLARHRPFVIAKWAMTLDGKIAARTGQSTWISGPRSRSMVHETRGRMDAVIVGIGTALADDPLLTARPPGARTAVRIVLDSTARLPLTSRLVTSARQVPVLIATTDQASRSRCVELMEQGCEVVVFPGRAGEGVPVGPLLDELGRRGMTNVLVEGGGRVLGSFFDAGEVDEVDVFIAPLIEGGDHAHLPVRGRGFDRMADALRLSSVRVAKVDDDFRIRGRLKTPDRETAGLDSAQR